MSEEKCPRCKTNSLSAIVVCEKQDCPHKAKPNVSPLSYSHSRYAALCKHVQRTIDALSRLKGGEYAGDEDRLANFRRNAERLGLSMEQVWAVYFMKHIDAILQHVKDIAEGKVRVKAEPLQGRVDDAIVYLILMKAILDEKGGENELKLEG